MKPDHLNQVVLSYVAVTKILITVRITWYWLELDGWV